MLGKIDNNNDNYNDDLDTVLLPLNTKKPKRKFQGKPTRLTNELHPTYLPPERRIYRNDTKSSGRARKCTAINTIQIETLQANIRLLSVNPCPESIVKVIASYLEADLYGLIPADIVMRAKAFLEMLYKKYDSSIFQLFGFSGSTGMGSIREAAMGSDIPASLEMPSSQTPSLLPKGVDNATEKET